MNLSATHAILLERDGAGVYTYFSEEFHPVDGRLLGNEGADHNHHFTYHVSARFTYKECWAQFVEMLGGDGVWVFIDGKLVVDIGGVDAPDEQQIWLDRLGLTDGEIYTLDLFYAQRQTTNAVFRMRTTLELQSTGMKPTVSSAFD